MAFVNATWRIETGNGTSQLWLEYNNPGGIKCGAEYCSYDSQKSGLIALNSLLIEYWEVYGMDIKAIRERYCQCGVDDYLQFMKIYHEELKKEQR
ncbi:glucosaminidase domain-containing protein [Erysipelothrix rhusiopathiae]|nr:glucosaminidase domain-containing protein [Erysipelothrix rhusiopathiae]MDE8086103.1 glucosaminidase domain-containing protein [Erysipelothrix rhusiopathiae]MDE8089627.1 glucosaminidase domain-containing protein [Erysipelothrix rhusiopathiae]MDE8096212.1 glucosaminidase domain-containing protein [Erysipelothrix rhusiopathiae]MDE8101382.1 glucosaminidase domain-containing protein [Erysipelothrix rhusiopathiae]